MGEERKGGGRLEGNTRRAPHRWCEAMRELGHPGEFGYAGVREDFLTTPMTVETLWRFRIMQQCLDDKENRRGFAKIGGTRLLGSLGAHASRATHTSSFQLHGLFASTIPPNRLHPPSGRLQRSLNNFRP